MINQLLFLLLGIFWGGSFVAIKYAIMSAPPSVAAMLRLALAILTLLVLFSALGKPLRVHPRFRLRVWICGLFAMGFPFALLFWGELMVSAGFAGIITGTVPIWSFVFGAMFIRDLEPFSYRKLFGTFLGLIGVAIVFIPSLQLTGKEGEFLSMWSVVLVALCYAIANVLNRYLLSGRDKVDFFGNVFEQHVAAFLFLLLLSICLHGADLPEVLAQTTTSSWFAIVYLAVFSTALALMFFYHLVRKWGAVQAASVTYLIPIFAMFFDFLFFWYPRQLERFLWNGCHPIGSLFDSICEAFQKPSTRKGICKRSFVTHWGLTPNC